MLIAGTKRNKAPKITVLLSYIQYVIITWERPNIRYKQDSLYPGMCIMRTEMELFPASKLDMSRNYPGSLQRGVIIGT